MKIVKKLLKIVSVFLLLLIAALIIIPIVFKDQIVEKVKVIANENVNANVDFGDFSLSLISSFPDFSFEISDVSVINKAPFEGDTLAYVGSIDLELDLMSVIGGEYVVSSFNIDNIVANAKIMKDGKANWDIALEDTTTTAPEEEVVEEVTEAEEGGKFLAGLESFSITNVNVSYVDLQSEMIAIIKGFNQSGSLILHGDSTDIDINTGINALTFVMEGDKLANKVSFASDVKIAADLAKMAFNFKENQFKLNELKLGLDGQLDMLDDMIFDLSLTAKDNKFKDLLSLIPAVYKADMAGIETKGEFSLDAKLKGAMTDESLPGFNVGFSIVDGFVKYPDLPESVADIQMDLKIDNKDGVIDHTVVDLNKLHMMLAKNPINIEYHVTNVESDPKMKGSIRSKFKLENLAKAIPMEEGEEYKGGVNVNLDFAGQLSSILEERYNEFKADGQVIFDGLLYKTPGLPTTLIKTGYLNFSPQMLEVSNFDMAVGKSDLKAKGKIDNIFSYVFNDETIKGQFDLQSTYFNLDELMEEDSTVVEEVDPEVAAAVEAAEHTKVDSVDVSVEEEGAVEVPSNIDFVLNSNFKKIDFDGMPIENLGGRILIKEGELKFENTGLEIFSGKIVLNGMYSTKDVSKPRTDLDFSIDEMGIGDAYRAFNTVQKMAPIAKNATGEFHTDLKMTTLLTDSMTPLYESLNGKGFLSTTNLGIGETDAWKNLIKALQVTNKKYEKIKAEDVKINYAFKNGKLYTEPFKLNLGSIKGEVSGWTSFDNKIEYVYALQIPREDLGGAANQAVDGIAAFAGNNGINVSVGEFVNIDVVVSGDMDDPKYSAKLGGTSGEGKSATDQAVDAVKEKVNEEVDKVKEKAQEELDKAQKEAEAKIEAEKKRLEQEAEKKLEEEKKKLQKEAEKKAEEELKKKGADALKNKFKF